MTSKRLFISAILKVFLQPGCQIICNSNVVSCSFWIGSYINEIITIKHKINLYKLFNLYLFQFVFQIRYAIVPSAALGMTQYYENSISTNSYRPINQ